MRLVLPTGDRAAVQGVDGARVTIDDSVHVLVPPLVPLPFDLRGWGDEMILGGLPPASVRVLSILDTRTDKGWPLTLVVSDALATDGDVARARRMHALYRFVEWGAVAVAEAVPPEALTAAAEELEALFRRGEPDFTTGATTAIADVWAGAGASHDDWRKDEPG
ncbi:MAG TPA: hypothetical protein VKE22_13315 [Haliangiales bacterium]|nr:hypothetical protein [Haliangiales bacterium]